MPESKRDALKRAKKEGFPPSSVQEGKDGWFIIPHDIIDPKAQRAYIHCRENGGTASTCAAVAHVLQNKED